MMGLVLCTEQQTMIPFLRRVPTNTLLFAIYLAVVAFAFICWAGVI
jgi:hypothetical protein